MSRYKGDNSGGYGNPPVDGQFKEGGKPGPGRPKGSATMDGALRKVFRGKVPYLENGTRKDGPATVALAKRALQHGLSGSAKANEAARALAAKYGPEEPQKPQTNPDFLKLTQEERDTFRLLLYKALGQTPPPSASDLLPEHHTIDQKLDGVVWRHTTKGFKRTTRLESVGNRAYVSATLPRVRSDESRLRPARFKGDDNEHR